MTAEMVRGAVFALSGFLAILTGLWLRRAARDAVGPFRRGAGGLFGGLLATAGIWLLATALARLFFGPPEPGRPFFTFFPPRMRLFELDVSGTVVSCWIAMALLAVSALIFRLFLLPRMREAPGKLQLLLELAAGGHAKDPLLPPTRRTGFFPLLTTVLALALLDMAVGLFCFSTIPLDFSMACAMALPVLIALCAAALRTYAAREKPPEHVRPERVRPAAQSPESAMILRLRRRARVFRTLSVCFSFAFPCAVLIYLLPRELSKVYLTFTPPRMRIIGLDVSSSILVTWLAMALLLLVAALFRLHFLPRMRDIPGPLQFLLETVSGGGKPPKGAGTRLLRGFFPFAFAAILLALTTALTGLFLFSPLPADLTKAAVTFLAVLGVFAVLSLREAAVWRAEKRAAKTASPPPVRKPLSPETALHRRRRRTALLLALLVWGAAVGVLTAVFGGRSGAEFHVAVMPSRLSFWGVTVSETVVATWIAMALLITAALLLRLFFLPRMKDPPGRFQLVLEMAVSGISDYSASKAGRKMGGQASAYLFTLALLLIAFAFLELFGIRSPSADITMTATLALISFFLIHGLSIGTHGVRGHLHELASPYPAILPLRLLSELTIPVSMACRLFGNTLGGMIILEMLYAALGTAAVGIPSVLGLYLSVFHPLIQAFIFITLTLTFMGGGDAEDASHQKSAPPRPAPE